MQSKVLFLRCMHVFHYLWPLFYIALFLWLIARSAYFKKSGLSVQSLQFAFLLKVCCGAVLFLLYTYYYPVRKDADTFKYFDDSRFLYEALWIKPVDFFKMLFGIDCESEYFKTMYFEKMNNWYRSYENGLLNDNRLVIRINAVFRLVSFGNYHVHSLLLNFLAFIGSYSLARLFLVFTESKWKTYLAVFLIPSVVFWSSGILKEAVLLFALGLFGWNFHRLMFEKWQWRKLPLLVFLLAILLVMKLYVFIAFVPAVLAWWISKYTKRTIMVHASMIIGGVLFGLTLAKIVPSLNFIEIMANKQRDFINLSKAFNVNSAIEMSYLEPNLWSFIKATPKALINTFTRPWLTEIKSILFVPPLLENLFIIGILITSWFYGRKVSATQWKFVIFCLTFSIILFLIIGLTTPIIGAIVRYKIPAIPFLMIAALMFFDGQKLPKSISQNRLLVWINSRL
jgi:hypothetical protein